MAHAPRLALLLPVLVLALVGVPAAPAAAPVARHSLPQVASPARLPGSIRLFSMVVIGGLGSLPGAILGAIYVRGAEFFLPAQYELLASGMGILLLLMFLPEGLGGLVYRLRDGFLRWVARRRSILVPSLLADVRVEEPHDAVLVVAEEAALGADVEVEVPEEVSA